MALKYGAPGGCTQTELCRPLGVKGANMSALVRRMAARGLVRREDDPADTRAWRVTLAPPGRAALRVAEPAFARALRELMGACGRREAGRFRELLRRAEAAARRMGLSGG
jgi:DNA-binding MarR family transcriptional regulator